MKPSSLGSGRIAFWLLEVAALVPILLSPTSAAETLDPSTESANPPWILAHYMPWYTANPASSEWGWHWTMNHFDPNELADGKREIASKFYPLIGPYDSGDPHVLEYHLLLMRLAGIDGVVVDWYGLTDYRDYAQLHRNTTRLLQQCERLAMKFVICYEDQTIPALVQAERISASNRVGHATEELQWLGKYWFNSPAYLRLDNKPVLLSFGHSGLNDEEWTQCLSQLPFPVAYFSQDVRRQAAMGSFGWPAPKVGMQQVDRFLSEASNWPSAIPAAFPRFVDVYREAKVGSGFPTLADNDGKTLETTLRKALRSAAPIVQIATWNDWGEGTQIEPSIEFSYRDLKIVQRICGEVLDGKSNPPDDAFELPKRLLGLRQSSEQQPPQANRIAELIRLGKLQEADELLDTLTGEPAATP